MSRHRFAKTGALALSPQAWGAEFEALTGGAPALFCVDGPAAVVDVRGPLVQRADGMMALFCDSYGAIKARVAAALEDGSTRAVVIRFDSPGGDVAGCFETAREIRAMARAKDKPLLAFVDGMAASAAYALASACDEIVVTSTGLVGSIGVIQALADQSRADAAMGLTFAFVTSGARKTDGNPHVPITAEAVDALKGTVDGLARLFFDLVAEHRPVSTAEAAALDGAILFGSRATSARLADRVSTWGELLAGLTGSASQASSKEQRTMSKIDEAMGILAAAAEGDDEDATKAKKMLKALEGDGEEKKEAKAEGDEGDADEKKKKELDAKARAEFEKKDADTKASARSTSTVTATLALAERIQALEAERAAERESKARAELLATRTDFASEVRATFLATDEAGRYTTPLASLEHAVKSWPVIGSRPKTFPGAAAAQASVSGTRGKSQVSGGGAADYLPPDEADAIDAKMGLGRAKAGIEDTGNGVLKLGFLTHLDAEKLAAKLGEKGLNQ